MKRQQKKYMTKDERSLVGGNIMTKKYCIGDIVLVKGRITEVDDSDEVLDVAISTSENDFFINSGDIHSVIEKNMIDPGIEKGQLNNE